MIFTLSNGTLKELARGSRMQIAIPVQRDGSVAQVVATAVASLSLPEWAWVLDARRETIDTIPASGGAGLLPWLGHIAHDPPPPGNLVLRVDVVILDCYDSRRKSWGSLYPPRWPAALEFDDGRTLPHAEA
jgi:hypothetical protein